MIHVENKLPDTARVWVYQSNRPFSDQEIDSLVAILNDFNLQWEAHGKKLNSAIEVFYNQFIVFFVDESFQEATGCSIDKSVALMKTVESQFDVDLFDRLNLTYKDNGEIKTMKMADFQKGISKGEFTKDITVFNNMVNTKADFLNNWEVPASKSWHINLF